MERRNSSWEPILDTQPTEDFVCAYEGPAAQHLEINRAAIDNFLRIASLDGRILLKDSNRRRFQGNPDINPDGSVTAKSALRWGEKPVLKNRKDNIYFQVEPDQSGWVISLNGKLIHDDLMEKGKKGSREVQQDLTGKLNYYLRVGLKEALLKDKLTSEKDPYIRGRFLAPFLDFVPNIGIYYLFDIKWALGWGLCCYLLFSPIGNLTWRMVHQMDKEDKNPEMFLDDDRGRKWVNHFRRTVENKWDLVAPPLEIDRVVAAYGYLDLQMLKGNPLLRLAH